MTSWNNTIATMVALNVTVASGQLARLMRGGLVGIAIVGNPLSATYMDGYTAEVTRTCTIDNAPKGTNSFLYSRCWQIWRLMGGRRLITYTLDYESGASLRGAGWRVVGEVKPHNKWAEKSRRDGIVRTYQDIYGQHKWRWEVSSRD